MAWTYSDYESQATDAERLTRLRLHIDEVSAAIRADLTDSEGGKRESEPLQRYMQFTLQPRLHELMARVPDGLANDPRVTAGFTRGRPL